MLRQNYIGDGNPYGIGNFGGCNCSGDFMASFRCAIIAGGITVNPLPGGDGGESGGNTAANITVEDKLNLFEGEDLETVLSEIGTKLNKAVVDIKFTDAEELEFTLTDGKVVNIGGVPAKLDAEIIGGGGAPIS